LYGSASGPEFGRAGPIGYGKLVSSNPDKEYKQQAASSSSANSFNDFDDDLGSYYLRKSASGGQKWSRASGEQVRRSSASPEPANWIRPAEDKETLDSDDSPNRRVKRQAYESSYENEAPCYGFPLEINVRSRIKFDQVFPIKGKSQFKKCIKVG